MICLDPDVEAKFGLIPLKLSLEAYCSLNVASFNKCLQGYLLIFGYCFAFYRFEQLD